MELALRAYEASLVRYRRAWRGTIATGFVSPVVYLAALGVGLGSFVNRSGNVPGGAHSYLAFVAPGLLAATAMQIASTESSYPVLAGIRWWGTYPAMLATPLRVRDIVAGHQLFVTTRVTFSAAVYLGVIAAFDGIQSGLAPLALPAAVLVGLAFSMPIAAIAAHARTDNAFAPLFRFVIVPMFLFSGTFYPITRLPEPLQWVAYATPLWHGVELCRDLTLGPAGALADLGHAGYLALWAAVGFALALRTHERRLRQ
jgi:lipooligosaccharide transport system permease protein